MQQQWTIYFVLYSLDREKQTHHGLNRKLISLKNLYIFKPNLPALDQSHQSFMHTSSLLSPLPQTCFELVDSEMFANHTVIQLFLVSGISKIIKPVMAKEVGKQNQSIKPIKQIIAFMN